ncbi:MAG: hypothetical protein Q4C85_08640 [Actinomyces sp.]|uniref:hypothetical protein n=1 Tax=Actinomyces sp. TaxID=29317 RepID=UPI0026DA7501|nr:hypothetical protein [Actinomyces sp.]MDO4243805.1 hypothetical protein [Actinomyces sp.]
MSDVKPTLTLAALEKMDAAAAPEPFTFGIGSRRISFPDPMEMRVEDLEAFAADLESTQSLSGIFRRWLDADDAEALLENLTARQASALLKTVQEHYGSFLGDQGEGGASATA